MQTSDRHLRFGWWSLLAWLSLGLALEALHGFKLGWYLDAGTEMRRLMFTLAHAHGTLLALINLAAAFTLRGVPGCTVKPAASKALLGASLLLPLGFLLGGLVVYGGDPGPGVFLVPVGGLLLLYAIASIARSVSGATSRRG